VIDNQADTKDMTDTPSPAQLEDWLRELEANLERLAERLNRIEHAQ
jgi:hypothetical protein